MRHSARRPHPWQLAEQSPLTEGVLGHSTNPAHSAHTVLVALTFSLLLQVISPKQVTMAHTFWQIQQVLARREPLVGDHSIFTYCENEERLVGRHSFEI